MLQHYQEVLGAPSRVAYIELGPGNGTLAQQILAALPMMPGGHALLAAMRIHMVEVSPGLRAMQAAALHCSSTTTAAEVRLRMHADPHWRCTAVFHLNSDYVLLHHVHAGLLYLSSGCCQWFKMSGYHRIVLHGHATPCIRMCRLSQQQKAPLSRMRMAKAQRLRGVYCGPARTA